MIILLCLWFDVYCSFHACRLYTVVCHMPIPQSHETTASRSQHWYPPLHQIGIRNDCTPVRLRTASYCREFASLQHRSWYIKRTTNCAIISQSTVAETSITVHQTYHELRSITHHKSYRGAHNTPQISTTDCEVRMLLYMWCCFQTFYDCSAAIS